MAVNGMHFRRSRIAAAHGARVLLSGFGGDQCVSSRGNHFESELLGQGRWREARRSLLARRRRQGKGGVPLNAWFHLLLKHGLPSLYPWLLHHLFRDASRRLAWRRGHISFVEPALVERYDLKAKLWRYLCKVERRSVREHHRWGLFEVEVDARLAESELCGRMFRLEQRFPMLDVRLVELAYNMPSHLKIRDGMERYMFRRILEGLTTERVRWHRKQDVDFPAIDRRKTLRPRLERLVRQLGENGPARRYANGKMLEEKIAGRVPTWNQEIRGAQLLLDVDRLAQNGEIVIIDGEDKSRGSD